MYRTYSCTGSKFIIQYFDWAHEITRNKIIYGQSYILLITALFEIVMSILSVYNLISIKNVL